MSLFLDVFQGFAIGAFAAISILYTFQTRIPYPSWVLQAYDKPWLFLVLFLASLIVLLYTNKVIGAMLILLLGAVWMDGLLFARPHDRPMTHSNLKSNDHLTSDAKNDKIEVWPFAESTLNNRISDEDIYGNSLDSVPMPEPMYPVFYGLDDMAPGPAPFMTS